MDDKRERLAKLETAFEEQGGRGVELAEEIDELRREVANESAQSESRYTFAVTVTAETAAQAAQVMGERIDHEEDYGFPYKVERHMLPIAIDGEPYGEAFGGGLRRNESAQSERDEEPRFRWQEMDAANLADLLGSLSSATPEEVVALVDEEAGGIVGYIIGAPRAAMFAAGLNESPLFED